MRVHVFGTRFPIGLLVRLVRWVEKETTGVGAGYHKFLFLSCFWDGYHGPLDKRDGVPFSLRKQRGNQLLGSSKRQTTTTHLRRTFPTHSAYTKRRNLAVSLGRISGYDFCFSSGLWFRKNFVWNYLQITPPSPSSVSRSGMATMGGCKK